MRVSNYFSTRMKLLTHEGNAEQLRSGDEIRIGPATIVLQRPKLHEYGRYPCFDRPQRLGESTQLSGMTPNTDALREKPLTH